MCVCVCMCLCVCVCACMCVCSQASRSRATLSCDSSFFFFIGSFVFKQQVLFRVDFLSVGTVPKGVTRGQNLGHLKNHFFFLLYFLAHLSRRLIGELIVYPWSGVRPSSTSSASSTMLKHLLLRNRLTDQSQI